MPDTTSFGGFYNVIMPGATAGVLVPRPPTGSFSGLIEAIRNELPELRDSGFKVATANVAEFEGNQILVTERSYSNLKDKVNTFHIMDIIAADPAAKIAPVPFAGAAHGKVGPDRRQKGPRQAPYQSAGHPVLVKYKFDDFPLTPNSNLQGGWLEFSTCIFTEGDPSAALFRDATRDFLDGTEYSTRVMPRGKESRHTLRGVVNDFLLILQMNPAFSRAIEVMSNLSYNGNKLDLGASALVALFIQSRTCQVWQGSSNSRT